MDSPIVTVNSPSGPGGSEPGLGVVEQEVGWLVVDGGAGGDDALGVVVAVGEDAELEHAHLGDQALDLLDLLRREVLAAAAGRAAPGQDDLEAGPPDRADRDVLDVGRVDPPLDLVGQFLHLGAVEPFLAGGGGGRPSARAWASTRCLVRSRLIS